MAGDTEVAACGCGTGEPGRKAVGVDQVIKSSKLKRLGRIEGQVRGIQDGRGGPLLRGHHDPGVCGTRTFADGWACADAKPPIALRVPSNLEGLP